jgi:hypothetical protein
MEAHILANLPTEYEAVKTKLLSQTSMRPLKREIQYHWKGLKANQAAMKSTPCITTNLTKAIVLNAARWVTRPTSAKATSNVLTATRRGIARTNAEHHATAATMVAAVTRILHTQ